MNLQTLGAIGDLLGGIAVFVSLLYLAVQIRQNTRAIRSSSYHQAAEQTWHWCLTVAQNADLADILRRRTAGEAIDATEQLRIGIADVALIYGVENMLRLKEEGLVDPEVWKNLLENSITYLDSPAIRALLAQRPGPLSQRLLATIDSLSSLQSPAVSP